MRKQQYLKKQKCWCVRGEKKSRACVYVCGIFIETDVEYDDRVLGKVMLV